MKIERPPVDEEEINGELITEDDLPPSWELAEDFKFFVRVADPMKTVIKKEYRPQLIVGFMHHLNKLKRENEVLEARTDAEVMNMLAAEYAEFALEMLRKERKD